MVAQSLYGADTTFVTELPTAVAPVVTPEMMQGLHEVVVVVVPFGDVYVVPVGPETIEYETLLALAVIAALFVCVLIMVLLVPAGAEMVLTTMLPIACTKMPWLVKPLAPVRIGDVPLAGGV